MRYPMLIIICFCFISCASFRFESRHGTHMEYTFIKPKSTIFLATPTVDSSMAAMLSGIGWTTQKYVEALQDEISFQFRKKKVSVKKEPESLYIHVEFHNYDTENLLSPSKLEGYVILTSDGKKKKIEIRRKQSRNRSTLTETSIVTKIRYIASVIVKKTMRPPKSNYGLEKKPMFMFFPT